MKNGIVTISSVLFMMFFSACSPKHSSLDPTSQSTIVYEISHKQASDIAHLAVSTNFPALPIAEMHNSMGYFVTDGYLDKQTYVVKLTPLHGTSLQGRNINGFGYDVYSEGTRFAGPSNTKKLFLVTKNLFDRTGKGVKVLHATQRKMK